MRMARGVLVLSTLTIAASAVNYGSNLAFARVLTPASYGDLTSLLALFMVVVVPFTAAQTRIATRVAAFAAAGRPDRIRSAVRQALAHLTVIAVIATLLYCAAIPLITSVFHLQAIGPAIALAALVFVGFLFPTLQGVLQGLERWAAFGLVGLAVAVSRLAFGIPWAASGGGAGGAIGGQALGMLVCLAGVLWLLRDQLRGGDRTGAQAGVRRPDAAGIAAGAAFVFFAVIANCDVVLAKIFLSPGAAGQYAALATIGKLVFFLPATVSVIVVPNASRAGSSRAGRRRVLRTAALMVAGVSLVAIIPAAVAPDLLIRIMFGTRYLSSAAGVLPIVLAGAGLALLYLLVTFTVAIEDSRWMWLLALGVGLQVALIGLLHGSATQVAVAQAIVVAVLLVLNEARFHSLLFRTASD
jgi:O-antigen/teichoic acid export membrane protein